MKICLVAIARNEGRFVNEWLAHNIAIGFGRIVVYDHESDDEMPELVDRAGRILPVERVPWSPRPEWSPQLSAYNHFLRNRGGEFDWVAFFDLDEFLVFRDPGQRLDGFLAGLPSDAGAVGINWLTFGSSGRTSDDYGLVRDSFTRGAERGWGNNLHIKTIARPGCVQRMGVHDALLREGRAVTPSGATLSMPGERGIAAAVEHEVAQLNHYQVKSRQDFDRKIARGRATRRPNDPARVRPDSDEFFRRLDRNEVEYDEIAQTEARFREVYDAVVENARGATVAPETRKGLGRLLSWWSARS
jgi:hypothetical protein